MLWVANLVEFLNHFPEPPAQTGKKALYHALLADNLGDQALLCGFARTLAESGLPHEAISVLQSNNTENSAYLAEYGKILAHTGNADRAMLAHFNAGIIDFNSNLIDQAADNFWRACILRPDDITNLDMMILSLQNKIQTINTMTTPEIITELDIDPKDSQIFISKNIVNEFMNFPDNTVIGHFLRAWISAYQDAPQEALNYLALLPIDLPFACRDSVAELKSACQHALGQSAETIDQAIIEGRIAAGQLSKALSHARIHSMIIDWPNAVALLERQSWRSHWHIAIIELMKSNNDHTQKISELWKSLSWDWQKEQDSDIFIDLMSSYSNSTGYDPSFVSTLFNLADGWFPAEKQEQIISTAISGYLHGTEPNYQAARTLIDRWWREYGLARVANVDPCQLPDISIENRSLRIGFLDLNGISQYPNYFNTIILPSLRALARLHPPPILYCQTDAPLPPHVEASGVQARGIDCFSPEAIKIVAAENLDILVLMNGWVRTPPLAFLAARPAHRLALWMHTYCSYGPSLFDAAIIDAATDTPFHRMILHETLLPVRSWTPLAAPYASAPPVASPPRHHNGYVTFGIFNRPSKFTRHMITLWQKILEQTSNSRLAFASNYLANDLRKTSLLRQLQDLGIHPDRIDFLPVEADHADRLALYRHIDIALDTYPFNGGVTTIETVWQGVPIITRTDQTPLGRSGLAILSALGLDDLAAFTDDQYIKKAVDLAQNDERLDHLRKTLRGCVKTSNIMDADHHATELTHAFRQLRMMPVRRLS